ncbi:zinc finger FYVE domain-containing protein 16 isoform X1 [Salmo salar]|uniref:Zinc finger FYVE domain-containing protein 16-like isoform X1 n=1 Tax=Salmo salar TaxID=8030 RepID=A0A1S3LYY8_SALSA|nr:zinc finger FYVE domain-containing protein 16-like isoform X1 [Salmo salar]XP_045548705.1 zinc finger FYVE domain-containing protein 16-like isoform X1 [Salmo salar]XP_045548708.1 zinc finger FYVE domain-containing protein 16-like isoform X1 [Salmo salar]XP_045548711.1 zinc finger FYVE domain-containing protein 16-like isoform X1 [Salmo salar]
MDNFFKAAVCDLDKLLDDFELNTDEHIYRSVSLSPPAYPGHSLGPQGFLPETSTVPVPHSLLDLNSLHYGTAPSCPDCPSPSPGDREAKGRPLTGVDLLSSVDGRGAAKSCAPPFPKRALKPVCDLVSDTGSAHLLLRANSHDAFSELDVVERRLEEELLVDFTSPVVALPEDSIAGLGPGHGRTEGREALAGGGEGLLGLDSGGYSASLSLLDVILPAAVERAPSLRNSESGETEEERDRGGEATEVAFVNQHLKITPAHQDQASVSPVAIDTKKEDTPTCDIDIEAREEGEGSLEPSELTEAESSGSCTGQAPNPEDGSGGVAESPSTETELSLSCLPMGVSMCGALVASKNPEEAMGGGEGEAGLTETLEAESLSAFEVQEEVTLPENPETVGDCTNPDAAPENKPVQSPNTQSPETTTMPFHLAVSAPAVSQRPLKVSFSLVEKQPVPGAPQCPASSPSEPSPNPMDPPGFGFEYLPESDQARLLVTDEELDAFLRGETQGQEDHGVPDCGRPGENLQDEGFSELNGNLEERLVEEELRSCSRSLGEGLERLPSRESDRTLSAEGNVSRALSAPSQDPPSPYHTDPSTCSLSNLPPPYYGGARPKQLHCQAPRAPPAAGEDQGPSSPTDRTDTGEEVDQSPSPPSPNPAEDPSNQGVPCPGYSPPECYVSSVGYDELSEPPPYPGEPAGEGSGSSEGREAEDEEGLGCKQPPWVPDSEAPNCMNCWQKFTFTRRRHHCRACGKVYCAICCNRRCKLKYLDKEARVCVVCFETVHRSKTQAQALECMRSPPGPSPNPNVPSEYCSTIPPLQQARAAGTLNSPPPTVMVPVSVLKNPGSDGCPREQKRVWFADGILPNGEVANTTRLSVTGRRGSQESSPVTPDPPTAGSRVSPGSAAVSEGGVSAPVEVVRPPVSGPWDYSLLCGVGGCVERSPSLLPEDEEGLPPLLITTGEEEGGGDLLVEERPAPCQILLLLEEGGPRPLTFVLNANLLVNVKLVTYCSRKCWCMGSSGLQTVGQREIVFILEVLPEERALPKDLFTLYLSIYQDAQRGKYVEELGNVAFTGSFLGSKEHGGVLFYSPTFQPLEGLCLPPQPFLCGLLIQRLEVPWAKVFPLRLLLRLGAEHSVYPSTLVSVRFRETVFRETGHTIMNLLADLRNYQYSLPAVEGLRIHMEMGHSYINIPKSSFPEMLKVVNASNEHVISVGAGFSSEADSHLVCFQNKEGTYQTQANSQPGKTRTVTGASFVVFNGALKASSGFIAKSSIVEDGLMVQTPPETMEALRAALRGQTDFHIPCGKADGGELRDNVTVRWIDWSSPVNAGVTSGVDRKPLEGVHSVRMQQDTEFESDGRTIRCTEVFYWLKTPDVSLSAVLPSCSVFHREMAVASCSALTPHLSVLSASGINSLALRVSTHTDMVEYQAGSGGRLLPQRYMNELDSALIPVIHGGSARVPQTAMDMEFIFFITHTV